MMVKLRYYLRTVLVIAIGFISTMTQVQAVTITDGDFSGWVFGSIATASTNASATASVEGTGGNPGERLNITTVTQRGTGASGTAINPDFSTAIPLTDVTFILQLDVLNPHQVGYGQAITILVEQNSNVYGKGLDVATSNPHNWETVSFTDTFTEDSFTLWAGEGPANPDFSGSTDTRFGFAGSNSWSFTLTQYYDNFSLNLVGIENCQPSIDIKLNSNNRVTGDKVVINAQIKGSGSSDSSCKQTQVEQKVWVKLPDDSVIPLIDPFTVLTLLPGDDIDTKIFEYTFSGAEPIGSYEIGGRLLHPFSGDAISTDIEVLTFSQ